jgi:hypothetical protein
VKLVCFVYLVDLVHLVYLIQPNKPNKRNKPIKQDSLAEPIGWILEFSDVMALMPFFNRPPGLIAVIPVVSYSTRRFYLMPGLWQASSQ